MPDSLTPNERTLRARLAAHTLHGKVDSTKHTEPARKAFLERFEREVLEEDPNLSPDEAARRARHRLQAHMTRMALKSAKARRKVGDAA